MSIASFILSHRHLVPLTAALWALAVQLPAHAVHADSEVERTLAIVELRGAQTDERSVKYVQGVIEALRKEKPADLLLIDGKEAADTVRKDRNQLPTALTEERRNQLTESFKRGVALFKQAEGLKAALKALTEAEGKYNAAIQAPGADAKLRDEYLNVLVSLARVHDRLADKAAAAETMRTVISIFGVKANVTEDRYPPEMVEVFRSEVKKLEKAGKGSVDVQATPAGARILLGGSDRGAAPAVVGDLPPGRYDLRLQAGSSSSLLRRVKVDAGATVQVNIDVEFESHLLIEDDRVGLTYPDGGALEARLAGDASGIGRDIKADLVCAVGVLDGKLAAYLVDVSKKSVVRSIKDIKVPAAALSDKAISRAVVTVLGERASASTKATAAGVGGGSKWYQSTPGWIAAGASVAMLGLGLAYSGYLGNVDAYYCEDPSKDCGAQNYNAKWQSKVDDFTADYKSKQMLSGIGLGSGVVLAGVAGWLFWREAASDGLVRLQVPAADGTPLWARVALPPLSLSSGPQRFRNR